MHPGLDSSAVIFEVAIARASGAMAKSFGLSSVGSSGVSSRRFSDVFSSILLSNILLIFFVKSLEL